MEIITAENIKKSYKIGSITTDVLKGISLTVKQGEFLAIMGKSGAGKSTLLYQLSLLDIPSSGEVIIDGTITKTLKEAERTSFRLHTLGYVFQDYALVPDLTAEENVLLPIYMKNTSHTEAKIIARKAIDEVGLKGKYENLPSQLSGGEQQRIAIARAIASKPKILFADEPTANLDSTSSETVIDLLTCLNKEYNLTIVMVTHEREYANNCNRILYLADGYIEKEEILKN